MFKKSKEDMLREIERRAAAAMGSDLQNANLRVDFGSVAWTMQNAIARAVAEGFKVMLENQYTDDEFEQYIGLKP